ncbi:MAG: hypothetical protein ABL921_35050 [Pirellula sp.]
MDHKSVQKLEEILGAAIAEAFDAMSNKRLPLKPNPQIIHLMAKAATAVYEAVVDGAENGPD